MLACKKILDAIDATDAMPLLSRVFFLSVHSKRPNDSRLLDLWKTKTGRRKLGR
jgi:hypothetical protein